MKQTKEDVDHSRRQHLGERIGKLIGWIILLAVSYIGSQYIVAYAVKFLLYTNVLQNFNSTYDLLQYRLAVYVVMAAMIAGFVWYRARKLNLDDIALSRMPQWRDIGLGIAGLAGYFVLTITVLTLVAKLPGFNADQQQDLGLSSHLFGTDLLFGFIVLVIITPLFEEAIFRGFLYGRLRKLKFSWWVSALVVSVLFGIAHGQWNVGIDVFCLSMVACGLRELTGSIWAGVLIHVVKNFVAFMLTFVFIQGMSGL